MLANNLNERKNIMGRKYFLIKEEKMKGLFMVVMLAGFTANVYELVSALN